MEYPKEVMKLTDLKRLGFPRKMLEDAFNTPGQTFAWRSNPASKSSCIYFSTKGFEKYRLNLVKLSKIV